MKSESSTKEEKLEEKSATEFDEQSSVNLGKINEFTAEERKEAKNESDSVETGGEIKNMDVEEEVKEKVASSAL